MFIVDHEGNVLSAHADGKITDGIELVNGMDLTRYDNSIVIEARNAVRKYFVIKSEKTKKNKDKLVSNYLKRVNL